MNIWFATNNTHKKNELEAVLGRRIQTPSDCGIVFNPEETGASFRENALLKARELRKLTGSSGPVIADDSGLRVDALGGRPGVFSARYGETNGLRLSGGRQNLLLLEELGNIQERGARFVCAMVLLFDYDRFFIVQETLEGEIVKSALLARGEGGFGYDPVFLLPETGRTLAELSAEEKNRVSHRGKAGRQIAALLELNVKT